MLPGRRGCIESALTAKSGICYESRGCPIKNVPTLAIAAVGDLLLGGINGGVARSARWRRQLGLRITFARPPRL